MNTRLGKSFGLAFVVAVGILALMFALGTFNAQKAGAQATPWEFSGTLPGEATSVTFIGTAVGEVSVGDNIVLTLGGYTLPATMIDNITLTLTFDDNTDENDVAKDYPATGTVDMEAGTITIAVPDVNGAAADVVLEPASTVKVVIGESAGIKRPDMIGTHEATASVDGGSLGDADTYEVNVNVEAKPETPGATAFIEVVFDNGTAIGIGDSITIDMQKFGLPGSIGEDEVALYTGTIDAATGDFTVVLGPVEPEVVTISGTEVELRVPDMDVTDANRVGIGEVPYRVRFYREAGITIPSTSDDYRVSVGDNESNPVRVVESLSLSKTKGPSGTEVTVTGKGFSSGVTAIFVDKVREIDDPEDDGTAKIVDVSTPDGKIENDEHRISGSVTVTNGSFSRTFEVDDNFTVGATNHINVLKNDGSAYRTGAHNGEDDDGPDNVWAIFTVTGSMSLDKDSVKLGETITVTLSDFKDGDVTVATIGGVDLQITSTDQDVDGGSLTFEAVVPPADVALGTQEVKVTVVGANDAEETATANVTVEGLPLTVNPQSAVPGQQITIRGSGFTEKTGLKTIMVGGEEVGAQSNQQSIERVLVGGSGSFVVTVVVPPAVSATGDDILVEVTENGPGDTPEGSSRTGTVELTIPSPTLSLNPTESRPDTTVVASGTGYAAGENVSIAYDGNVVISENADTQGAWTQAFTVPINTDVGDDYTVMATGNSSGKSESATHTVPGGVITVSSAQGRPGDLITVNGVGFKAYSSVVQTEFGGLSVHQPGINTDENGDFTVVITVPALPEGTHSLVVGVGGTANNPDDPESFVFTVTPAGAATLPSADAFADLTAAGNLIVVWYFDNTTKEWSFYDPRPEVAAAVDLTMVTSGDNVWIQITADQMFQGKPLTAGWNLVTLD